MEEETGVTNVQLGKPLGVTWHPYFDNYLKKDVIKESHWFAMQVTGQTNLVPQTEEDIEEIIWADETAVNECLQNSYPNIVEIIKRFREEQ